MNTLIHDLLNLTRGYINCYLTIDIGNRFTDAVWVVGDGRSGTTWLANILNYNKKYRYMFEPFHPRLVEIMKDYPLYYYLRPDEDNAYFYKIYRAIFRGNFRYPRVDQYNYKFIYRKRIVKDIFSNLYIKWAHTKFPSVKKIFIMRHPFAVVASKIKLKNWIWMEDPKMFLSQEKLYKDYLKHFEDVIQCADDFFEKQMVIWAIVHHIPLHQLDLGDVYLMFYEKLCTNPQEEIKRLFSFIGEGESTDNRLYKKFKKPSQTCHNESAILKNSNLIDGWRRVLSDSQIKRGINILSKFGLEKIYNYSLMPDESAAEDILKRK